MPTQLASFLVTLFIAFLFIDDFRRSVYKSWGILVPYLWILIISSRAISTWLDPVLIDDPDAYLDGTPLDRYILLFLIVLGVIVLIRKRINWSEIIQNNIGLFILFGFALLSIIWSEYPFVSFKRFIKAIGNVEMALIVATEINPKEAMNTILRRVSFFVIPISVLFIKYYPDLGRSFTRSGEAQFIGVTLQKNSLGLICLILGLFYIQNLFNVISSRSYIFRNKDFYISIGFLLMISWLLYMANSATSLALLFLGILLLLLLGTKIVKVYISYLGFLIIVSIVFIFISELMFDLTEHIIELLGRDITLTGRIPLWEELLKEKINPVLGTGFESFWLGERAQYFWEKYWWHPNQAHNGYLELYLNMGLVGLGFLMLYLFLAYRNIKSHFFSNYLFGKMGLILFILLLIYNITEGIFLKLNILWMLVIFFSIKSDNGVNLHTQINLLITMLNKFHRRKD